MKKRSRSQRIFLLMKKKKGYAWYYTNTHKERVLFSLHLLLKSENECFLLIVSVWGHLTVKCNQDNGVRVCAAGIEDNHEVPPCVSFNRIRLIFFVMVGKEMRLVHQKKSRGRRKHFGLVCKIQAPSHRMIAWTYLFFVILKPYGKSPNTEGMWWWMYQHVKEVICNEMAIVENIECVKARCVGVRGHWWQLWHLPFHTMLSLFIFDLVDDGILQRDLHVHIHGNTQIVIKFQNKMLLHLPE